MAEDRLKITMRAHFGHDEGNNVLQTVVAEPTVAYWTWKRLGRFVLSLSSGRALTPGEWHALQREIPSLSIAKKNWLYHQLKPHCSPEGMEYLFDGWKPNPRSPCLDLWL